MIYELGVDLGTTFTAAAVHRAGRVDVIELGNRAAAIPSVVLVREDEGVLTGEAAERRAVTEPERVAREFKRRIGDPTPLLLGGRPYSAEQLQSRLLRSVVARVSEREGSAPARVAVTYPANWGPYKLDLLAQALRMADLDETTTISEPEAAAIHYASQERVEPGSLIAVYDLGGGTFDAAVLRKTADGFEILGRPEGIERLGGIDFDEAVFAHVTRALGGAVAELDPGDPTVAGAVARLRQECVDAKEALSADTEASIPIVLPNVQTEVRITRAEFESLVRPTLTDTIGALHRALRTAEVTADDLSAVLLVGGSSRIPLVAQLVGAELGRPVAVDAHPKYGVAMGAALSAAAAPEEATEEVLAAAPVAAPGAPQDIPSAVQEPQDVEEQPIVPDVAAAASAPEPVEGAAPVQSGPTAPVERPSEARPAAGRGLLATVSGAWAAAAAVVLVVLVVGGGVLLLNRGDGPRVDAVAAGTPSETATSPPAATGETEAAGVATGGPTPSDDVSASAPATADEPASPTEDPTPDIPADVPYVTLDSVVVEDGHYVVRYTPSRFEPVIGGPGTNHVHFFWDTFEPSTVGTHEPAATRGEWVLYATDEAGEFRFVSDVFTVGNRPDGANRVCGVVADHAHQVVAPEHADEAASCLALPT